MVGFTNRLITVPKQFSFDRTKKYSWNWHIVKMHEEYAWNNNYLFIIAIKFIIAFVVA